MPKPEREDHSSDHKQDAKNSSPAPCSTAIAAVDEHSATDLLNPRHWPLWKKWTIIFCVSLLNFVDAIGSSASATAVPALLADFGHENVGRVAVILVVSVYVLGVAVGPVIVAPLSEKYGRLWLYNGCSVLFVVFNIGCARSTSIGALIALRALCGVVSAVPPTLGAGSIADLMDVKDRTMAIAVWALGAIIGRTSRPTIGPVAGAFIAEAAGWRWIFWALVIVGGAAALSSLLFMRETHHPTILRKAAKIPRNVYDTDQAESQLPSDGENISAALLLRPLVLLFTNSSILALSAYSALAVAYLYIFLTTLAETYTTIYGFSVGVAGLVYLSMGLGAIVGQLVYSALTDRTVRLHTARGDYKPEHRLLWAPIGSIVMPLALLWFGWSVEERAHWMVSVVALFPLGFGLVMEMVAPLAYLIDAFPDCAASAVAATVISRAVSGAFMPLISVPLYDALGQGWGNSLLALVAFLLVPVLLLISGHIHRLSRHVLHHRT
ncbi:putative major facilitator superfamily transporter [Zymoseptoria tritici IPO323]|uniref:Major facilitator superfamily transporter n=1 Tax=Zymoseptoria tritici (strain CBS 115943 / IPO323) TaxID=336722 RepID=F9XEF0_ZYMTI|nr:putative major facilitator superfamily transporter [Zymoseptoria tritici IPO323]EGP86332.1 putative major facilitator superfamily transporter [Zymoseptoria tritici IPO323]